MMTMIGGKCPNSIKFIAVLWRQDAAHSVQELKRVAGLVLGLLLLLPTVLQAQVQHVLHVVLQPESHWLHVTDTIT